MGDFTISYLNHMIGRRDEEIEGLKDRKADLEQEIARINGKIAVAEYQRKDLLEALKKLS